MMHPAEAGTANAAQEPAWQVLDGKQDCQERLLTAYMIQEAVKASGRRYHMPAKLSIEEARKLIDDPCLMDDVFFTKCFDGSNACTQLMHDLSCTNPDKMHYNVLRERTGFFKRKKEGILDMATKFDKAFEELLEKKVAEEVAAIVEKERAAIVAKESAKIRAQAIAEGLAEAREEGARKTAMNVARSMLADGSIPIDKVARFSGLPLSEVEGLRSSIRL